MNNNKRLNNSMRLDSESLTPTTLEDLKTYKNGAIINLPPFAEGQPFVARVKRPSLLVLAKSGKIPNSLLATASQIFSKGGAALSDKAGTKMLENTYELCEIVCEACLVEPTYDEIKSVGLTLSDNQLMALFNYTQMGVKALNSFR